MKPLPPTIQNALIELLAATDVLFTPHRGSFQTEEAGAAIFDRRYLYPRRGIRTVVGGDDDAIRRSGNRAFGGLVTRGLAKLVGRGKHRGLLLTPHGDDYARQLTGGFSVAESFGLLAWIDGLAEEGRHNAGYVNECEVLGTDYDVVQSVDLAELERKALPLFARGWLETQSDLCSHVGYQVTDAGRAATRPSIGKLPAFDHDAAEAYNAIYLHGLKDRLNWRPEKSGMLWIALSAGNWPANSEAVGDG